MSVKNLKQALHDLINKAGMTQDEIAKELGCSQATVNYHMHSEAKNPRPTAAILSGVLALTKKNRKKLVAAAAAADAAANPEPKAEVA